MAFYPQFYHKTDREGRPIYIEQLGKLDTTKLAQLTNQDRQLHHLVDEYERFLKDRLPATTKVEGKLVETSCTILDLTNAGISTFYKGESRPVRQAAEPRAQVPAVWKRGRGLTSASQGLRLGSVQHRAEPL